MFLVRMLAFVVASYAPFYICGRQPASFDHRELYQTDSVIIPLAGNTFGSGGTPRGGRITNNGIRNWSDSGRHFTTYVRLTKTGPSNVALRMQIPSGESRLEVAISGQKRVIRATAGRMVDYPLGSWNMTDTGYVAIHIRGIDRTGPVFADIDTIALSGAAIDGATAFVKNNEGNFFYWGRRGPSVHLNYALPDTLQAAWFYNEIRVPPGEDVLGSYFMADGFGEGYFGMQVNSPRERHILFSVWSPFKTDNPKLIPPDKRVELMKKGEGVHAGEFGNEGSGGQSYLNFPWTAGKTYEFLLHGVPDGPSHTVFTAYFYAPEDGHWRLIASFRRPATHTYLTRLHSFLENFKPEQGDKTRSVQFLNQWVRTADGRWISLSKARFTTDNTGRKGYRMDYAGGVADGHFFLKNCGFFNEYTPAGSWFTRPESGGPPDIDLNALP